MSRTEAYGYIKSALLWSAMVVPFVAPVTPLTVKAPNLGVLYVTAGLVGGVLTGVVAVRLGWVE